MLNGDIHTAEDITQEVFTRLYVTSETLSRQVIHNWLYSALRYVRIEHLRKNSINYTCEDINTLSRLEDETISYLEDHDIKIFVDEIIQSIVDPVDKMIFEYITLCGHTYKETADILSLPPRKVRYRYSVVIKGILKYLSKRGIKHTGDIL
jgi:RNA polymerase sigma factor (sigma-70 family)